MCFMTLIELASPHFAVDIKMTLGHTAMYIVLCSQVQKGQLACIVWSILGVAGVWLNSSGRPELLLAVTCH